jgi:hypothetical protein
LLWRDIFAEHLLINRSHARRELFLVSRLILVGTLYLAIFGAVAIFQLLVLAIFGESTNPSTENSELEKDGNYSTA